MAEGSSNVLVGDEGDGGSLEGQKTWVEIELVDVTNRPMAGVKYQIRLPDGSVRKGRLDEHGVARVERIRPGECAVEFPELHRVEWTKAT
jgi:hypothetical protein